MNWIFFASLSPFFWSFSNFIDEYLVKHHFAVSPVMMILAAAIFSIIPGGLALLFYPPAFEVSWAMRCILGALDVFILVSFIPYIKAIQLDGASVAVPLFQTIPVFTFLLGWFFLGEIVSVNKILASMLIVISAVGITWNFKSKKVRRKTLYLMFISSFGIAVYNIISRYIVSEIDWISMMIWMWIGSSVAGTLAAIIYRPWRESFCTVILKARVRVLSLFVIQAGLDMVAMGLFIYALSLAPAAGLVSTMNGLQPFYVLVLGGVLGFFMSKKFEPVAMDISLAWKVFCIVLLFIGVMILSLLE